MNDDEVVILHGLEENDRVLLTPPPDHDRIRADASAGLRARHLPWRA